MAGNRAGLQADWAVAARVGVGGSGDAAGCGVSVPISHGAGLSSCTANPSHSDRAWCPVPQPDRSFLAFQTAALSGALCSRAAQLFWENLTAYFSVGPARLLGREP